MTWPFENDTSAITKKLANRSIKADKRRNIFIIVTIAFAACLMTVLALYTFGKSHELKTFLQGRYQAAVIDVDLETINDLRQDSNIEMVGTEALVDSFRVDDYTLNVNFRDSNNLYLYSTEFVGNLPDKENEVAVSEAYLKHIGRPVELNQEIELPLQNGKNANFTVCGLLHDDGANRRYQVLVSDSFLQSYFQDHIPYNATLRIMGSGSFKEDELKNLIKSCLTPYGIREEQIAYSSSYFDSVDNSSRDMLGVAAISILIVIACSTVIYSLFYISVVGKVKEYGRLRVIGMSDTDYNGTYFFVPENMLSEIYPEKKNFNTEFVINADVNQLPAAENVVLNAIGDNPDIQFNSFDDALSSIKMHMTGYQIPIYGLIVFIAIFGIINLCNTLMTNLVSRQQEFGVLQSIGLSNKQLYKMLRMECLYYVFGTMAITFIFGTAAGYILCQIFNQVGVFGKLHYTFPFLQVLLFFAVLVVIALIYSTLAIRYCHKQSLVDRIKTME